MTRRVLGRAVLAACASPRPNYPVTHTATPITAWNEAVRGNAPHPMVASVLTTAGDLVFTGEPNGWFNAWHARTGELLWRYQTGNGIHSNPITYSVDGKQYIAVPTGWGGWLEALPRRCSARRAAAHSTCSRCPSGYEGTRVRRCGRCGGCSPYRPPRVRRWLVR